MPWLCFLLRRLLTGESNTIQCEIPNSVEWASWYILMRAGFSCVLLLVVRGLSGMLVKAVVLLLCLTLYLSNYQRYWAMRTVEPSLIMFQVVSFFISRMNAVLVQKVVIFG